MSKDSIHINSIEELDNFLKVLTKESVRHAYDEEKEREQAFQRRIAGQDQSLQEQDPEEEPEAGDDASDDLFADTGVDDAGGDDAAQEPTEDPTGEPEAQPAPEEPRAEPQAKASPITSLTPEAITPESVTATVNLIRAGRSFEEPAVQQELEQYLAELSDSEKVVFGANINALYKLVAGEQAEEIPDAGDPGVGAKVVSQKTTMDQQQPQQQQQAPQQQVQAQPQVALQPGQQPQAQIVAQPAAPAQPQTTTQPSPAEDGKEDLEDTEAPIVVGRRNESVQHEAFRAKIRELIRRGGIVNE